MTGPVWDGRGVDPWLPARLNARLEAAQVEREIRAAVWAALSEWLVVTGRRVLRAGSPPDLDAIWARTPAWREAVELILQGAIFEALKVAYERILGRDFAWSQRVFVSRYLTEVRNRLVRVPEEVYDLMAGQLSAGINLGEGISSLAARIDNLLSISGSDRWENRATVIARTETIAALNASRYDAFKAVAEIEDEPMEQVWLSTTGDGRTRPTHRRADGQRRPLGQPFRVGGFELRFPGDPDGPPQEVIQCVIGSTEVRWPGQGIHGTTRRFHSGPFVQLITGKGHDLTVTPNHPVLTPEGYVPAGLLRPGQYVLSTGEPPTPEIPHTPSSAEQVHSALGQAGKSQRVMGSRMDFHGDGSHGEVEVVGADGYLPEYRNPRSPRQLQEGEFVWLSGRQRPLSGASNAVVLDRSIAGRAGGLPGTLVGRTGEGTTVGGTEPGESEPVGLATSPDLQAQLDQAPDDGRTAEADFPAHLQYALAAGMEPTELVQVNRLTGHHWVYNLSTTDHWFTGSGIVLHNCRCTMLLVEVGEVTDMSNRGMRRR